MKVKLSWIPFILFTPVLVGLALYTSIFPDEEQLFLGFGVSVLPYAIAGVTLAMFLFCLLFKAIDRKTADYYVIKRNIPAGLFGLVTAASIAAEGGLSLLEGKTSGNLSAYTVVYVAFTLLAALAVVIMSLMHLTRTTSSKGLSVYLLMPTIWSAVKLVNVFVNNAEISLANTDVLQLLTLIVLTLYLFFYAQLISAIKSKGTLKNTIVLGLMSVSLLLANSAVPVYDIVVSGVIPEINSLVPVIQNVAFVFYIFSFVAEVSSQALRKDEMKVFLEGEGVIEYGGKKKRRKGSGKDENEDVHTGSERQTVKTYEDKTSVGDTVREQLSSSDFDDIYSEDISSFSSQNDTDSEKTGTDTEVSGEDYSLENFSSDSDYTAGTDSEEEDKLRLSEVLLSEIEKENAETSEELSGGIESGETSEEKLKRIDQLIFQLETDESNL